MATQENTPSAVDDRAAANDDPNPSLTDPIATQTSGSSLGDSTGIPTILEKLCQQMTVQSRLMAEMSVSQSKTLLEFSTHQGQILKEFSNAIRDLTIAVKSNTGPSPTQGNLTALASMPTPPPPRSFSAQIDQFNFADMSPVQAVRPPISRAADLPTPPFTGPLSSHSGFEARPQLSSVAHTTILTTTTTSAVPAMTQSQFTTIPTLTQSDANAQLPCEPEPGLPRRSTAIFGNDALSSYHTASSSLYQTAPGIPQAPTGPVRMKIAPKEYDGKEPWQDYKKHFEAVARANGWPSEFKTVALAPYLRGTALAFYNTLSPAVQNHYGLLDRALENRFSALHQRPIAHIQLRGRVQKDRESLADFATDVQRLVYLAFPDCPETARGRIALGQFTDGLADLEVQQRVRDAAPETLETALALAIRMEASRDATRISRRSLKISQAVICGETPQSKNRSQTKNRSGKANRSA